MLYKKLVKIVIFATFIFAIPSFANAIPFEYNAHWNHTLKDMDDKYTVCCTGPSPSVESHTYTPHFFDPITAVIDYDPKTQKIVTKTTYSCCTDYKNPSAPPQPQAISYTSSKERTWVSGSSGWELLSDWSENKSLYYVYVSDTNAVRVSLPTPSSLVILFMGLLIFILFNAKRKKVINQSTFLDQVYLLSSCRNPGTTAN